MKINALFKQKKFSEVIAVYNENLNAKCNEEDSLCIAKSYLALGDIKTGCSKYREIIKIWPKKENLFAFAKVLYENKQYNEAIGYFATICEVDWHNIEASHLYFDCLYRAGFINECEDKLRTAINSTLLNEYRVRLLDLLIASNQSDKVIETLRNFPHPSELAFELQFRAANLYNQRGAIEKASQLYLELTKFYPTRSILFTQLGEIFLQLREHQKALNCFLQVIKIEPENAEAHLNCSVVLLDYGANQKAIEFAEQSIKLDQTNATALATLGQLYRRTSQFSKSIDCHQKALNIQPNSIKTLTDLGNTYFTLFDIETALRHYLKAYEYAGSNNKNLFYHICECLIAQGRISDFRLLETKFDQVDPIKVRSSANVALILTYGRAGSMFLHSLLDGHREIITIPGVYLSGWFSDTVIQSLTCDWNDVSWREVVADRIINIFEPMFTQHSEKNVPGAPLGTTLKMAEVQGLDTLDDGTFEYVLDQRIFKDKLVELLNKYDSICHAELLIEVHNAFHGSFYSNDTTEAPTYVYHIHNPNIKELGRVKRSFKNHKIITILREPIQNLESWISLHKAASKSLVPLSKRLNVIGNVNDVIVGYLYRTQITDSFFVKLEDLKHRPEQTLVSLCEYLSIGYQSTLLDSTFMGKKYTGPKTITRNVKGGFDKTAILQKPGRIFSESDQRLLEIVFHKVKAFFGYPTLSDREYKSALSKITKLDVENLQFEDELYFSDQDFTLMDTHERSAIVNIIWMAIKNLRKS